MGFGTDSHVLIYPYLSVQSPLQQLRVLRPVAPDRTMSEIWHFRLKGVSQAIYRRALWYFNLVNSPATLINADDLENWTKGKQWAAYIDLFTADGVYWMPVTPEQTEWLDSPSIFAEDRRMMEICMGRVTHPNAWSQAPQWGTSHLVGEWIC